MQKQCQFLVIDKKVQQADQADSTRREKSSYTLLFLSTSLDRLSIYYTPNYVYLSFVTKYKLCLKLDCKQILKGLF